MDGQDQCTHVRLAAARPRPGLVPELRLLALATTAIGPADWVLLAAVVAAAQPTLARPLLVETLLQATLFFGFPRVVTAFEHLSQQWPAATPPAGGDVPADEWATRGAELFAAIYGRNEPAVRDKLRSCHTAFHDFVLEAAYGRILCRPGLDARTRELLAVTALATLQQVPQLIAHARGALAFGADRAAVGEAIWTALEDDAATAALLRRV